MLKLALVQYSFDAIEHSIQLKPHQNAKGTHMPPYRQQKASTVKKLTSGVQQTKSATKAMKQVYQESGGIQNVRSGSELPRNVQQAHYLRNRKLKTNLLPYQTLTHLQLSCSSVNQYVSLLLTSKYVILYDSAQTLLSFQSLQSIQRSTLAHSMSPQWHMKTCWLTTRKASTHFCAYSPDKNTVSISPLRIHSH